MGCLQELYKWLAGKMEKSGITPNPYVYNKL